MDKCVQDVVDIVDDAVKSANSGQYEQDDSLDCNNCL